MEPYGKGKKQVLVVGEAPGETEDQQGRPFIGKAGQYLRDVLDAMDVDLDKDAITTNACICRPPKNATPDPKQITWCRPNLLNTINEHNPRVVITLGSSALRSVLGPYWKSDIGTLERWVGWQIPLAQHWVCPTYHPSFLLRMRSELLDKVFFQHLEAAFGITESPRPFPFDTTKVERLYEEKDIVQGVEEIESSGRRVAFDYETNCLKPEYEKAKIYSCALSNGKRTIAYPWAGAAIPATQRFLANAGVLKIASNLKFEDRWSRVRVQTKVRGWDWDTMLAAHCLDNRPGICSLKFQAFVNMGLVSYNEHIEPYLENHKGHYNRIHEISTSDLLLYNGMDALVEYYLARFQRRQMGYDD